MRIRHDPIFVSTVLFTVALLSVAPPSLNLALALRPGHHLQAEMAGELGIASLAMIAVGLVVTWTGYRKGARSAWFTLVIIVGGWAFPVVLLPFVMHVNRSVTLAEWVRGALEDPGTPRMFLESVLIFSLMIVALILPIKSFFWRR